MLIREAKNRQARSWFIIVTLNHHFVIFIHTPTYNNVWRCRGMPHKYLNQLTSSNNRRWCLQTLFLRSGLDLRFVIKFRLTSFFAFTSDKTFCYSSAVEILKQSIIFNQRRPASWSQLSHIKKLIRPATKDFIDRKFHNFFSHFDWTLSWTRIRKVCFADFIIIWLWPERNARLNELIGESTDKSFRFPAISCDWIFPFEKSVAR